MHEATLGYARQLDINDDLAAFKNRFLFPTQNGNEQVYFLGNSLGLQPVKTKKYIDTVLEQWNLHGVEGFFRGNNPWMNYHDNLLEPLSEILGAKISEITVMNQLTVNLHLMMVSFYQPDGKRNKIICEAKAFPSDQYMMETHVKYHGLDPDTTIIEVKPRESEQVINNEDIIDAIERHKDELALVLWGGVNYYTGQLFDMAMIAAAAKKAGAKIGFDLAHAAGNVPVQLHDWDIDFACWCNYKYLNGGPGAVAGAFIHERYHTDKSLPRFAGWWGYDKASRFEMEKGFVPIKSAEGWQLSTPSPLLYASLEASLEIFKEAGWVNIQEKRKKLSSWLWFLLDELHHEPGGATLEYLTPRQEHGCQVSIFVKKNGKAIFDGLGDHGIMTDWREPNVIRIAPVPLYNSFEEVWHFFTTLRGLLKKYS
jgi:kynureninase